MARWGEGGSCWGAPGGAQAGGWRPVARHWAATAVSSQGEMPPDGSLEAPGCSFRNRLGEGGAGIEGARCPWRFHTAGGATERLPQRRQAPKVGGPTVPFAGGARQPPARGPTVGSWKVNPKHVEISETEMHK